MGRDRTNSVVFGHLKLALQTAGTLANLSQIPAVNTILSVASNLITVLESVKTNKEDCKTIADNTVTLVTAITKSLSEKDEQYIDVNLKVDLEDLTAALTEINDGLMKIADRSLARRVLMVRADTVDIQGYKDRITAALQVFQVQNNLSLRIGAAVAAGNQDVIISKLNQLNFSLLAKSEPLVSSIPPACPAIFHGRDDYVNDAVTKILTQMPARLAILGAGGMGKTSVAVAILHHPEIISFFGAARYFIPCDSAVTSAAFLNILMRVLPLPNSQDDPLKSLLNFCQTASPLFLVLDNFETPWDGQHRVEIEGLLNHLASLQAITLLITMRGTVIPGGLRWTKPDLPILTALDPNAARATYLDICSVQDDSNLDVLLREVDYVALAVTLIAKLAESDKRTPAQMLHKWRKHYTTLLKTGVSDRLSNLDLSISLSVSNSLVQHDQETLQLLSLVCTLPDGVFQTQWSQICAIFKNGDLAADALRQVSLAYRDSTHELQVLSPIRHYVLKNHKLSQENTMQLRQLYFKFATQGSDYGPDNRGSYEILTEESGNITSVLLQSLIDEDTLKQTLQAAIDFSAFLLWTYPSTDLLHHILLKVNDKSLKQLKVKGLSILSEMEYHLNQYTEAISHVEEAKLHYEDVGDTKGVASCSQRLGNIARMLDEYDRATTLLKDAKSQYESIGNRVGVAQCLWSLGEIAIMLHQYDEATDLLKDAKSQYEGISNKLGAANCLWSLGDIDRMLGHYDEAVTQLEVARCQHENIGSNIGVAGCLWSLGDIARMLGQYDKAVVQLYNARELYKSIGDRDGAAWCSLSLGETNRLLGQFTEATAQLHAAKAEFHSIGIEDGAGWCLKTLNDIDRALTEGDAVD